MGGTDQLWESAVCHEALSASPGLLFPQHPGLCHPWLVMLLRGPVLPLCPGAFSSAQPFTRLSYGRRPEATCAFAADLPSVPSANSGNNLDLTRSSPSSHSKYAFQAPPNSESCSLPLGWRL